MLASKFTYNAIVADDTVRNVTVSTDAGVTANENVLLHLAAVTQADSGPSVDIVARVGAAPSLLVREVRFGGERVDPPSHKVR